jgi:microbial collagenase
VNIYGKSPWVYASASAAGWICNNSKGVDYYGTAMSWGQIQAAILQQYLPANRIFDGGAFNVRYGGSVSTEKVKTLIWAHKETRALFFRAMGWDTPVDSRDITDNALAIMIYNSPYEYQMNALAMGLSTNNGGVYIEQNGTFYTYERTPDESIYTLEELFRHEGVHYLQGRYEEPGVFGGALYANNRLTWMDEGSAEFFAGSTRTEGVKTRLIKARILAEQDPSTWYTIPQVFASIYAQGAMDGDLFYNYASELVDCFYHNNWNDYLTMLAQLRANDGTGFDATVAAIASSSAENSGYQAWLQHVVKNVGVFPAPSTSPDYLATIPAKPLFEVVSDITALTGVQGLADRITTTTCQDWNTYTLRGTYIAGTSKGSKLADWQAMDSQVNSWLAALTSNGWTGYKTITCYFVNYITDASEQVAWQVVFHGISTDAGPSGISISSAPASVFTGGKINLSASVMGGDSGVVWAVTGGTLNAATGYGVVFTAPSSPSASVTIMATCTSDASKNASVTLSVIERDANGLLYLAGGYGSHIGSPNYIAIADMDSDGVINDNDLKAFLAGL